MCGRSRSVQSAGALAKATHARLDRSLAHSAPDAVADEGVASGDPEADGVEEGAARGRWERYGPRENLHPGNTVCALVGEGAERKLKALVWGLVPAYHPRGAKFDFFRMFNARSETVHAKGVFKRLLQRKDRRCVVLLDGFYEWTTDAAGQKQPWYLREPEGLLYVAGLCDVWRGEEDGPQPPVLETCTLLTTEVHPELNWLHNRMPVLLREAEVDAWLGIGAAEGEAAGRDSVDAVMRLCEPKPGLHWHPVTKKMNAMKYHEADCAEEVRLPPPPKPISAFFAAAPLKKRGRPEPSSAGSAASPPRRRSPRDAFASASSPIDLKKTNELEKTEDAPDSPPRPKRRRVHPRGPLERLTPSPSPSQRRRPPQPTPPKAPASAKTGPLDRFLSPRKKK